MPQDLDALLLTVNDEKSFIDFVAALASDFAEERELEAAKPRGPYGAGPLGWENGTIDEYLGAAAACGTSTLLGREGDVENPWRRCAEILYAGKFYE